MVYKKNNKKRKETEKCLKTILFFKLGLFFAVLVSSLILFPKRLEARERISETIKAAPIAFMDEKSFREVERREKRLSQISQNRINSAVETRKNGECVEVKSAGVSEKSPCRVINSTGDINLNRFLNSSLNNLKPNISVREKNLQPASQENLITLIIFTGFSAAVLQTFLRNQKQFDDENVPFRSKTGVGSSASPFVGSAVSISGRAPIIPVRRSARLQEKETRAAKPTQFEFAKRALSRISRDLPVDDDTLTSIYLRQIRLPPPLSQDQKLSIAARMNQCRDIHERFRAAHELHAAKDLLIRGNLITPGYSYLGETSQNPEDRWEQ